VVVVVLRSTPRNASVTLRVIVIMAILSALGFETAAG
jgi:hypothetical protein